ncbi:hypothetical protein NL108_013703 [Boleophthalmus pectinirostris]|uniref:heme-binding protein 2-like n=1 Tax=Boleophthalmus pectinirostris TaxID=150288 RepID=UPI000A1C6CD9|nr:heme-binding protein 2-like [Boleophthalmus pectinirostris]KAJ0067235.1 hypothetical protein NL108_013703 [Boleophthalmus pectinirostris]
MDPPRPAPLALLLALVLGFTVTAQAWDKLEQCQHTICPRFTRKAQHETYEERVYEPTKWICTEIQRPILPLVMGAQKTLKEFSERKSQEIGIDIVEDTWPGLLYQDSGRGMGYGMCWLVRPEVPLPDSDSDKLPVKVKTFPQTTMFVRLFSGPPSLEEGQENAEKLKEDLRKAGETFNDNIFYGAGYEGFLSLTHHSEIWIPKA